MTPWWDQRWLTDVAWHMALVPLAWLTLLAWAGRTRDAAYWWLAIAFAVSWLADLQTALHPSWVPAAVYPVAQTSLVAAVICRTRVEAWSVFVLLAAVAVIDIASGAAVGPAIALRVVSALAVCWILNDRPELPQRLRLALAIYFGLGLVAWLVHARWLSVATWYPYQLTRLAGLACFAWFVWSPIPSLEVLPVVRLQRRGR